MTPAGKSVLHSSPRHDGEKFAGSLIALHWIIGLAIIAMLCIGLYMVNLPKGLPFKATLINFHKSLGVTIFLLVLLRIVVRLRKGRPPLPWMPPWQRLLAHLNQGLLYACMIVMPVSGYLGSSFNRYGVKFWGVPLPKWGWDDKPLRELFFGIHTVTMYILIALIILHILGAFKHHWIDRDGVLRRMLP